MTIQETNDIEAAANGIDLDAMSVGVLACMQAPECTDASDNDSGGGLV